MADSTPAPGQTPPATPAPSVVPVAAAEAPKSSIGSRIFSRIRGFFPSRAPQEPVPEKKEKVPVKTAPAEEIMWTVRLERWWDAAVQLLQAISTAFSSKDRATRRMALVFVVSMIVASLVVWVAWKRLNDYRHYRESLVTEKVRGVEQLGEFIGKQAEEARRRHTTLSLGEFVIELKKPPGTKKVRGVLNLALVDIIIECDVKDTCDFIRDHHVQAKNQMTNAMTALDRDVLMSLEGKRRIKRNFIDRLNAWLPHGKVESLYFAKLVID